MSELTMFAYPWDIDLDGPEAVAADLARRGVTRVAVAAAYHSAEVITPRRTRRVVTTPDANTAHMPLAKDAFSGVALSPSRLARERPNLFPTLADAAAGHGLRLTGWVVTLHNSSLAEAHPGLAIESCFGDRSNHGLCPANPVVATYATELVAAVAATGYFDRLFVESATYLLVGHGHPHELWGVRLDARTRLLSSLCFCRYCTRRGTDEGIDVEALRARCAERLHTTWNGPLSPARMPDEGLELAAALVVDADLAAYVRMRCKVVSELARRIAEAAHARDVGVCLSSAVWARPAPLNWAEGVDLAAAGAIGDELGLTTYTPEIADVARELDVALEAVPAERTMVVNTLWPEHHGSADVLAAKVRLARDAGVRSFGLYNYAMAPAALLPWIDRVAEAAA